MKYSSAPVLLLAFNRADTTEQVFRAIAKTKPAKLFFAVDGPRSDRENEAEACRAVQDIILMVDWDCEVKTLFREQNLGCGTSVPQSISWFFSHEEMGVILEDDILVHENFFDFVDQMLEKYMHDSRIMMVSGYNFSGSNVVSDKYFFTGSPYVWGWATWRRAWDLFDFELAQWPKINNKKALKNIFPSILERYRKTKQIAEVYGENAPDTWDPHWALALIANDGKVILPEANLCRHIGFDSGTHYGKQPNKIDACSGNIEFGTVTFPLNNPDNFIRNYTFENLYVMNRLKSKIRRLLRIF